MPSDPRVIRCLDGLYYSFSLLDFYQATMHETCARIPEDGGALIAALATCWGFVDSLHRAREIAQSIPGLSGRTAQLHVFLAKTEPAEAYRHYIQHLRGELAKSPPDKFPVWGSIAWVSRNDPLTSHLVFLGARPAGAEFAGCVFDLQEGRYVSNVTLSLGNTAFNFDPIYASACAFRDFILPWLIDTHDPPLKMVAKPPIVTMTVKIKEGSAPEGGASL